MAFVVGNRARVRLSSAALSPGVLQPQPSVLGVVTKVAGTTITVLAEDGTDLAPDAAFLDQITTTAANIRNLYLDKVVTGSGYASTYTGRVVDVYDVTPAASGLATTKVLIRSLLNGAYYELPTTGVAVLGDR